MTGANHRPIWAGKPSLPTQAAKVVVVVLITLAMLWPMLNVLATSLAKDGAVTAGGILPQQWSFDAYRTVLAGGVVGRALAVSAFITITGTTLAMICTSMMAYGLTRTRDLPGLRAILYIALFTMLFGAGMIPNYLLIKNLGLLNNLASLILPGLVSAFNLVVLRNFYLQIPRELVEAARIDGCSDAQIFWRIMLPLSKAVTAVLTLFYAVAYWNTFFNALLYISDSDRWPIQLILNLYVIQGSPIATIDNPNQIPPPPQSIQMAVVMLALVPILLAYPFCQRYFTSGVLTGSVKG